ncbi:MAG: right-handed parallel beta-helix repeat-containing protein [Candidatus Zixiibacteriota bacterium]|nr:MAG: right-handed parallel beta-helix repeat-containing protein [candidate division Zixibacteria bacterium]
MKAKYMLLLFLILLASSKITLATIYFVSPTGNDNNPGTQNSPWLTISKACSASVVNPGDYISVEGGSSIVYKEGGIVFSRSGTAQAPITMINTLYPSVTVDSSYFNFASHEINHWRIFGFDIKNGDSDRGGVRVGSGSGNLEFSRCSIHYHKCNGFYLASGSDNIEIYDCDIHHNGEWDGSQTGGGEGTGIALYGDDPPTLIVERSKIHENWHKGIAHTGGNFDGGYHSLIDSCWIINNYQSGIDFQADSSVISYNWIAHNGVRDDEVDYSKDPPVPEYGDKGLGLGGDADADTVHHNVICSSGQMEIYSAGNSNCYFNNTVIKDHYYTIYTDPDSQTGECVVMYNSPAQDFHKFKNNIFVNYCRWPNLHMGVYTGSQTVYSNQDWDYNIYWSPNASAPSNANRPFRFAGTGFLTLTEVQDSTNDEDHSYYVDPVFTSYADSNFISQSVYVLNQGVNVGLPFSGNAPERGAYEIDDDGDCVMCPPRRLDHAGAVPGLTIEDPWCVLRREK